MADNKDWTDTITDEWPEQEDDMNVISAIIDHHLELNEGKPLGLLEFNLEHHEDKVAIRMADWIVDIAEYFCKRYGSELGSNIAKRALANCLINGETVH
ncbi:MAG: hypothetical protein Tsb005_16770 [Gammaproteobacteria bacterium]